MNNYWINQYSLLLTFAVFVLAPLPGLTQPSIPEQDILVEVSTLLDNGEADMALAIIRQAVNHPGDRSPDELAIACLHVANHFHDKRAQQTVSTILEDVEQIDWKADSVAFLYNLIKGGNLQRQYVPEEVIRYTQKALAIYRQQAYVDSLALVKIFGNIGNAYYIMYQFDSSGFYLKKILPLLQNEEVLAQEGVKAYWSLGTYYNSMGLVDSVIICGKKARALLGTLTEQTALTHIALNSNTAKELGKVARDQEALELLEKNNEIIRQYQNLNDHQYVINSRFEYATILGYAGRYQEAQAILKELIRIESNMYGADHINIAYNILGLAKIYSAAHELDSSLFYLNQAKQVAIQQQSDYSYFAGSIDSNIGELYVKMNRPNDALIATRRAMETMNLEVSGNKLILTDCYLNMARAHLMMAQYDSANLYLVKANNVNIAHDNHFDHLPPDTLEVYSKPAMLRSLVARSEIEVQSGGPDVLPIAELFLKWRRRFDKSIYNSNDLLQLVELQNQLIAVLLSAPMKRDTILPLVLQLHENNQNKLLVNELEFKNAKHSVLPDSIRISLNSLDQTIARLNQKKIDAEAKNNETVDNSLFELQQRRTALLGQIKRDFSSYFKFRFDPVETSVTHIRSFLEPNEVLLKYIQTPDELFVFCIDDEQAQLVTLAAPLSDEEINLFQRYLRAPDLEGKEIGEFSEASFSLYQKLVQPLAAQIAGKDLIIIPDQKLSMIPFEAFVTDNIKSPKGYGKLPYLIKENAVSYLTSIQAMALASHLSDGANDNTIAAFVPTYQSMILPWSKKEVESITSSFKTTIFSSETNAKSEFISNSSKYKYIHFAGHGIINNKDPMESYLLFSDESEVDKHRLTTAEIYSLNLYNEMVVLSACETGVGSYLRGEGIISLSRGFLFAGAKSILMNWWKANDQSTSQIVKTFYEKLEEDQTKSKALQQAKMQYLQQPHPEFLSHPYYWAGFVASGDMSSLHNDTPTWWISLIPILMLIIFTIQRKQKM